MIALASSTVRLSFHKPSTRRWGILSWRYLTDLRKRLQRMWYEFTSSIVRVENFWLVVQVYYCAFIGSFGEFACNPRTLGSSHLNHMVSLEGIVTRCSLVRPKVVRSVHYNERKSRFHFREYKDQTMTVNGPVSTNVYPTEDEEGNPVSTRFLFAQKVICWTNHYAACYRIWVLHI